MLGVHRNMFKELVGVWGLRVTHIGALDVASVDLNCLRHLNYFFSVLNVI